MFRFYLLHVQFSNGNNRAINVIRLDESATALDRARKRTGGKRDGFKVSGD